MRPLRRWDRFVFKITDEMVYSSFFKRTSASSDRCPPRVDVPHGIVRRELIRGFLFLSGPNSRRTAFCRPFLRSVRNTILFRASRATFDLFTVFSHVGPCAQFSHGKSTFRGCCASIADRRSPRKLSPKRRR